MRERTSEARERRQAADEENVTQGSPPGVHGTHELPEIVCKVLRVYAFFWEKNP